MKKYMHLLVVIILALFIAKDLTTITGFPSTHDGENHLARIANYYLAVKQGQIPPRFAPNLEAGIGYTSLNFNYPLANIIALPLMVGPLSIEAVLKIIFILAILLSSTGMYTLLRGRYGKNAALVGAVTYVSAPYFIGNIYVRGNVGESLAFAILPWALWFGMIPITSQWVKLTSVITLASFWLSHNLIAVLAAPLVLWSWFVGKDRRELKSRGTLMSISLLLVSFFWLPALAEKKFIVLDNSPLSISQLTHHFVRISQLTASAWDHGYSYGFPVDGMDFSLGLLSIVGLMLAVPITISQPKGRRFEIVVGALVFGCLFMTTAYSEAVWKLFSPLAIIQFPWRMLFFVVFFSSILTAFVFSQGHKAPVLMVMLLVGVSLGQKTLGINYFSRPDNYYFTFPLNTTILNENDPVWYDRTSAFHLKDGNQGNPLILNASGSSQIMTWNGSYRQYALTLDRDAWLVEKTMFFPGWETTIDGQSVDLSLYKDRYAGLINYPVSAGSHIVVTRFTQNTPSRIIGNTLTVLGVVILVYIVSRKSAP